MNSKLSVVIGGLGMPSLRECMDSMASSGNEERIAAIDFVGRSFLEPAIGNQVGLCLPFPPCPSFKVVNNDNRDNWEMTNQTLNIGMEAATGDWVLVTHEDTLWNGYPFITEYERVIAALEAQDCRMQTLVGSPYDEASVDVVSVYFPFTQRGGGAHEPGKDVPTLGACYSAVSSIIKKSWWEEIGRFDEEHGIFYDYQVTAEMVKRGVFGYVHPLPGPLPYHERSVDYTLMQSSPHRMDPGGFYEKMEKWDLHRTFSAVYGGGLGWHEWMRKNERRFECQRI